MPCPAAQFTATFFVAMFISAGTTALVMYVVRRRR